jgi:hypothetical protein
VAFAVGGAFLSLAYFDFSYNLMVMVVLANKWLERRAWETEPDIPVWDIGLFNKKNFKDQLASRRQS